MAFLGSNFSSAFRKYRPRSRLGSCRGWTSAVGDSGYVDGWYDHIKYGINQCYDHLLDVCDFIYGITHCGSEDYG